MKKLILFLFLISMLGAFSCSDMDEPLGSQTENALSCNSKFRSEAELVNIASQAYELINGQPLDLRNSRGFNSITITPLLFRASRGGSDTLIQVVNYGNEQGFALVGALKGSPALLAVVEQGDYNYEEASEVEGFTDFVNRAESYVSSKGLIGDTAIAMINTRVEREYVRTNVHGPHLPTQWGQRDYFGVYCPNGICGCVPLATAETMSFLEAPTYMNFTFPEKDIYSAYLNWQSMKGHFKRHSDVWPAEWEGITLPDANHCPASDYNHANLGRVVRQIGYDIHAIYMEDATGAVTYTAVNYLKDLVPEITVQTFTSPTTQFVKGLNNGIAMISYGSHCWVIDGYAFYFLYEKTYRDYRPETLEGDWRLIKTEIVENGNLLHHNWGWNGYCNGFFLADCYEPNNGIEYDPGATNIPVEVYQPGTPTLYLITK